MPEYFAQDQALGFSNRTIPVSRLVCPLQVTSRTYRAGALIDSYTLHRHRKPDILPEGLTRNARFCHWLDYRLHGATRLLHEQTSAVHIRCQLPHLQTVRPLPRHRDPVSGRPAARHATGKGSRSVRPHSLHRRWTLQGIWLRHPAPSRVRKSLTGNQPNMATVPTEPATILRDPPEPSMGSTISFPVSYFPATRIARIGLNLTGIKCPSPAFVAFLPQ